MPSLHSNKHKRNTHVFTYVLSQYTWPPATPSSWRRSTSPSWSGYQLTTYFKRLHFEKGNQVCAVWHWGEAVRVTWTALSPNPARREPKRPPTVDPGSQNLLMFCFFSNNFVTWTKQEYVYQCHEKKRGIILCVKTCVLRQRSSRCGTEANC